MRKTLFLLFLSALTLPLRSDPGLRQVSFEVDGSVNYANLTATTGDNGGREQNQVSIPYHKELFFKPGSELYLSAQKTRVTRVDPLHGSLEILDDGEKGTVHVTIRMNGAILQEASASAPFGIATASARIAE
jgi:hypothetical protein